MKKFHLRKIWLLLFHLLALIPLMSLTISCGQAPPLSLKPGKNCNPIKLLKESHLYDYEDLKTGEIIQPFSSLFKNKIEHGCLVSVWKWDKKEISDKEARLYFDNSIKNKEVFYNPVTITQEGKLYPISSEDGNIPKVKIPNRSWIRDLHFRLYFLKGTDRTVGEINALCAKMQYPSYNCFDKNNGEECQFFIELYPTSSELQDILKRSDVSCRLCAPELCNSKDDDCDGKIDNIYRSDKLLSRECYTGPKSPEHPTLGKGICVTGTQVCQKGQWEACKDDVTPQKEKCDLQDNDCNGLIDDGGLCPKGEICVKGKCQFSPCRRGEFPCGDECVNLKNDHRHCGQCNHQCPQGQLCVNGQCQTSCPEKTPTVCGMRCVDTETDPNHCGQCNHKCEKGELCFNGKCVLSCPKSSPECGPEDQKICCAFACCENGLLCVDIATNPEHCGKCGNKCLQGQLCVDGKCLKTCPTGTTKCGPPNHEFCCPHDCCQNDCVDLQNNRRHCGKCGQACPSGQVCFKGTCTLSCPKNAPLCGTGEHVTCCSLNCCGNKCVDFKTNPQHCGGCNQPCPSGYRCLNGHCQLSCPKDSPACGPPDKKICCAFSCCHDQCVDINTNHEHCGKCDHKCLKGQICVHGQCKYTCPSGQLLCENHCVDIMVNPYHCGQCGNKCPTGARCESGKCKLCPDSSPACGPTNAKTCCSLHCCNNSCVDIQNDPNHCGKCGHQCPQGQSCQKGKCTPCPDPTKMCGSTCCYNDCCNNTCVNTSFNPQHCGSCGKSCKTGETCCSGDCVDLLSDNKHCGSCDNRCHSNEHCSFGHCCKSSKTWCGSGCFNLQKSEQHCGHCGNPCSGGKQCLSSKCQCPNNYKDCQGVCRNLQNDDKNCGSCGHVCSGGKTCTQGQCTCPTGTIDCNGQCLKGSSCPEPSPEPSPSEKILPDPPDAGSPPEQKKQD